MMVTAEHIQTTQAGLKKLIYLQTISDKKTDTASMAPLLGLKSFSGYQDQVAHYF